MTSYLFFAIQAGIYYQQLKRPLNFTCDHFGLSNWLLRFPLTLYSADLREKHVFTEDSVSISSHSGGIEEERWKYLVVTQNDGKRLYCTAQVYYDRGLVNRCVRLNRQEETGLGENQEFYLPKWLVFLSEEPYFKMQVNLLKIFRQLRKTTPNIAHPTTPNALLHYKSAKSKGEDYLLRPVAAENNNNLNIEVVIEYYLSKCNDHRGADTILLQKYNNIPVLHLYYLKELALFQLSHFFNLPLSNKNIQVAITAILLEKQLIIVSRSTNLNVMVIQSLLQIVRPLRWQHMLVHNLPTHLIEAANQNFMPFIVGVNKKDLELINTADRFVVIVDEDRIIKPEVLPTLKLDGFPKQSNNESLPSHVAEKQVLQFSIEFMCGLLEPLVRNKNDMASDNKEFYECFKDKTTIFDSFMQKYESGQLKQFARLLALQDHQQRKQQIQKKLNQQVYYVQHPKFLTNETEWMDFYLSRTNLHHSRPREVFASRENRLLNLREVKQNVVNDNQRTIQRIIVSSSKELLSKGKELVSKVKEHSVSHRAGTARPRSIQRLKVSMVRQEKCHPFMAQLLEQKLGISSRMG